MAGDQPDAWEEPDDNFGEFVSEVVRHRLGKYVQPEHPNRIQNTDAQLLYK